MKSIFGRRWKSLVDTVPPCANSLPKIPRHEDLLVGDVILQKGSPNKDVTRIQRSYKYSKQACEFTHACLYVGNLHVLESLPPSCKNPLGGVKIASLFLPSGSNLEMHIARHKELAQMPERHDIGRRALLDYKLWPERYGVKSAINSWLMVQPVYKHTLGRLFANHNHNPDLRRAATCSEFVLKHLVTSARILLKERAKLGKENRDGHFFPATIFDHKYFDTCPLDFHEIER